jgi:hypothetical protein
MLKTKIGWVKAGEVIVEPDTVLGMDPVEAMKSLKESCLLSRDEFLADCQMEGIAFSSPEDFARAKIFGVHRAPRSGRPRNLRMGGKAWRKRKVGVFARDGHKCVKCGVTDRLECDHIRPICEGGTNSMQNLRTLCAPCHRQETNALLKRRSR